MTRKRFTKLIMSRGYQRNKANNMACVVGSSGVPYDMFWDYACGSPVYVLGLLSYM